MLEKTSTEELIIILLYPTKKYSTTTINNAKLELTKRKITQNRLDKIELTWTNQYNRNQFKELIRKELYKSESYTIIEMLTLIFVGPLYLFKPNSSSFKSLTELRKEGSLVKFKQKISLIVLGCILFSVIGIYYYSNKTSG